MNQLNKSLIVAFGGSAIGEPKNKPLPTRSISLRLAQAITSRYNPNRDSDGRFGSGTGTKAKATDMVSSGAIAPGNELDEKLAGMTDSGYNYDEQFIKDIKKEDMALKEIYATQGFNGKPTSVKSWEEFDALESPVIDGGVFDQQKLFGGVGGGYNYEDGNAGGPKNPITEFSRGFQDGTLDSGKKVTAEAAIESFANGDTHWAGKGLAGNGTYVAMKAPTAAAYTNNDDLVGAISFKLDSSAKVGSYTKLSDEMTSLKEQGKLPNSLNDVGRFAAAKGFDAYVHDSTSDKGISFERTVPDMAIILNRSKVVFGPSKKASDMVDYRMKKAAGANK
jgi:hypothetical protein